MKLSVVYHSKSGNTRKIAELMATEAGKVLGVEAKAINIEDADEDFIRDSDAVIFGCPTYCGTFSWQMKKFMDTSSVNFKGKLGSAFATENYIGGGAELAELSLIACMLVRGMIVYTGGATEEPKTHFGAVVIKNGDEFQMERSRIFARKIAQKTSELFS